MVNKGSVTYDIIWILPKSSKHHMDLRDKGEAVTFLCEKSWENSIVRIKNIIISITTNLTKLFLL